MLKKRYKLKNTHLFDKIFQKGLKVKSQFGMLIGLLNSESEHLKIGVVVSKKVCKKAVDRNKIKRQVYSIFREAIENRKSKLDYKNKISLIYVVFNQGEAEVTYTELEKSIKNQINKLLKKLRN